MNTFHIFKVIPVPEGHKTGAKVKIQSQRFNQSVTLSGSDDPPSKTAAKYLQEQGFNIVGEGEGILNESKRIKEHFLISDTFKPLK